MLVLTRKPAMPFGPDPKEESEIIIPLPGELGTIKFTLVELQSGGKARIGIDAPLGIEIWRGELAAEKHRRSQGA